MSTPESTLTPDYIQKRPAEIALSTLQAANRRLMSIVDSLKHKPKGPTPINGKLRRIGQAIPDFETWRAELNTVAEKISALDPDTKSVEIRDVIQEQILELLAEIKTTKGMPKIMGLNPVTQKDQRLEFLNERLEFLKLVHDEIK